MVFSKYNTSAGRCVFITDTLGDIREAKEHETGIVACPWGFHTREMLEEGIPFRIVNKPADLSDAVADYFSKETH